MSSPHLPARRYRWALLGVAGVVIAGLLVSALRHGSPDGSGDGPVASSTDLLPAGSRHPAPELAGVEGWINTAPLTLHALRGKVVLIDFWTFSCVNCVRTLPHLRSLRDRYHDRGFEIIGVHSPEFDFEKDRANVASAVHHLQVTWPVALDPQMATWNAYNNEVWPAEYLVDQSGRLSYRHLGEGDYEATEKAVATLVAAPPPPAAAADGEAPGDAETPELYAGSERGRLADGERYGPAGVPTVYPDRGPPSMHDTIQVTGTWTDRGQYLAAATAGHVRLSFQAQRVLVVAGSEVGGPVTATVTVDGRSVPDDQRGSALGAAGLVVHGSDLYPVVVAQDPGHHLIDLAVPAGFRLYTFTFG